MSRQTVAQTSAQGATPPPPVGGLLQRACACGQHTIAGGECEECSKKRVESSLADTKLLQRRTADAGKPSDVPPIVYEVLRSPGQPLDSATRAFFEPRFGHDFSQVRVHTDAKAAESAQALNALAYTLGRDVIFGARQHAPRTLNGQRLLAHELTHVVQQGGQPVTLSPNLATSSVDSPLEQEADGVAGTVGLDLAFETEQYAPMAMKERVFFRGQSVSLSASNIRQRTSPTIQRAVRFSPNHPLTINHWTPGSTTIAGNTATVIDGDFEAAADINVDADAAGELANWEVGFLQNAQTLWDRTYWRRAIADGRGKFLERKLRVPASSLRDHLTDGIVWSAPGEFADVASHAGGGTSANIPLTSSDEPPTPLEISGSDVNGADASDGTTNIFQHREGWNFVSFVSAHNTATDEWRHLELIYWSVQASVDFAPSPAGGVTVTRDDRLLGKSRRFRWTPAADQPAIGVTRANAYVSVPANWTTRRVEGWT